MKTCIVLNCTNTDDPEEGGMFIGDLCAPCHQFITEGQGAFSQAYRNGINRAYSDFEKTVPILVGRIKRWIHDNS